MRLPNRTTAKATLVVDEAASVLFGSAPGKVEVTNFPAAAPPSASIVKDANGVVVGAVNRTPETGAAISVVRTVGNIGVELAVTQFGIGGTGQELGIGDFYYEDSGCLGPPLLPTTGASFYGPTLFEGTLLYYPTGPATPRSIQAHRNPNGGCTPGTGPQGSLRMHPLATLDVTSFVPPFSVEVQ